MFNFVADESIILEKLMGRRVCPSCNKGYNMAHIERNGYYMKAMPPKTTNICDKCGIHLVIRDDDKESVIQERFAIYRSKTEPILSYYRTHKSTVVLDFEAKNGVDDFP